MTNTLINKIEKITEKLESTQKSLNKCQEELKNIKKALPENKQYSRDIKVIVKPLNNKTTVKLQTLEEHITVAEASTNRQGIATFDNIKKGYYIMNIHQGGYENETIEFFIRKNAVFIPQQHLSENSEVISCTNKEMVLKVNLKPKE